MKQVIGKIEKKYKVCSLKGASIDDIENAEKELNLSFSKEYKKFLAQYGIISFGAHEIFGLGTDNYLNVVNSTKSERSLNPSFPADCIVLENNGIEGLLTLQDSKGIVYSYFNGTKKKIASSLSEYLESLL